MPTTSWKNEPIINTILKMFSNLLTVTQSSYGVTATKTSAKKSQESYLCNLFKIKLPLWQQLHKRWSLHNGWFFVKFLRNRFFKSTPLNLFWLCSNTFPQKKIIVCSRDIKGYLSKKIFFCHTVALDKSWIIFFIWGKNNILFSRYLDFCVFGEFTN